jgi:hypothetical protein
METDWIERDRGYKLEMKVVGKEVSVKGKAQHRLNHPTHSFTS